MIWLLAAAQAQTVDLNTATVAELDALPSLGPAKAEAIVQWRALNGPCTDPAELAAAPGVGAATFAAIRDRIRCGPAPEQTEPPKPPVHATAPEVLPGVVDINHATAEQLMALPGMMPARAEAIVADRERQGPFASCGELVRVAGIGPATVANMGSRCTVSE